MFLNLSEKLQSAFKKLKGKGILTEKDVSEAMREVRLALLEADVNFKIVKSFITKVSERATGESILKGLNPAHAVIKIVNEELVELLGSDQSKINFSAQSPTIIMMVGLQGSGKTTTTGKLALYFKKQGKNPLLVACDIYRPAAIKQLQVLGDNLAIPVFEKANQNPAQTAIEAIDFSKKNSYDLVIIDTAGRLHIDDELMGELSSIKKAIEPNEILLVIDSMTGQDAVNVAQNFSDKIGIDGIILTKLDGDTRGGAALSVRSVTGKPIKFIGQGEKTGDLDAFYPDRMANRILGMGDILTLIDKAQSSIDIEEAKELEKKLRKNEFNLEDFLSQMQQIKKMGPLQNILSMMPGMNKLKINPNEIDDNALKHVEAIIYSMTIKERRNPDILNGSRKKRISLGSGRSIQEVNRLLKQFNDMKSMMKQFSGMGKIKKKGLLSNLPFGKN